MGVVYVLYLLDEARGLLEDGAMSADQYPIDWQEAAAFLSKAAKHCEAMHARKKPKPSQSKP